MNKNGLLKSFLNLNSQYKHRDFIYPQRQSQEKKNLFQMRQKKPNETKGKLWYNRIVKTKTK